MVPPFINNRFRFLVTRTAWNPAEGNPLIDNKKGSTCHCGRAVAVRIVANVVRHSFLQDEGLSVLQFGGHFTVDAKDDMSFIAPMIGAVTGGILHAADADAADVNHLPLRVTGLAVMPLDGDGIPVHECERYRRIDRHTPNCCR